MAESSDLDPLEWLVRLGPKLLDRQGAVGYWRRYYEGNQDLPAGPNQHREAYRRFQKLARTNLCLLCAESMVHRMQVTGYRDGTSGRTQDNAVWAMWQAAKLDARQYTIWRKALSRSVSYVIVGVDPKDSRKPRVTIEGPENVIVECDPADSTRRLAALRLWHDSIAKRWLATLYLPGRRYHWRTVAEHKTATSEMGRLRFTAAAWEERSDPARSLPEVPVVPFCNADEGEEPKAAFDVGIDVQNRLNLTLLNRLSAERYSSFRQRYLTNYEVEIDEVTGLPIAPFNPGTDQTFVIPPPEPGQPESKFGDLSQTDTSQMLRGTEADMRAFAAVTLTPVYYLPGDLINISADSVAALDAGHVAKIRQLMAYFGEGLEEVLQLMAFVAGLDRDLDSSELVWARPENFNPAQVADYASKLKAAGFPLPMIAEEIGWSPQRVRELRAELASQQLLTAAATIPAFPTGRPDRELAARSNGAGPSPGDRATDTVPVP